MRFKIELLSLTMTTVVNQLLFFFDSLSGKIARWHTKETMQHTHEHEHINIHRRLSSRRRRRKKKLSNDTTNDEHKLLWILCVPIEMGQQPK